MISTIQLTRRVRYFQPLARRLRTQAQSYDYAPREELDDPHVRSAGLATPRQLVKYLDEFVIGQENAKKVLSVAVFNHYNRVRANLAASEDQPDAQGWNVANPSDARLGVTPAQIHPHPQRLTPPHLPVQHRYTSPLFEKSNVLVIGPTGSGKTLLARTLARVLDVPFSVSDATSFTQAGYVGEDVEMAIQRLLQAANWDPARASTGIVYIDEVDKIARKVSSTGTEGSRDVGGEGVQQALLRMMEGSVVTVQGKSSGFEPPSSAAGEGRSRPGARGQSPAPPRPDTYNIDTSNVLFVLSGAFVGLDTVVKRRVAKGSIGFTATLAPKDDETDSGGFLPFFTPNRRTSHNILDLVEPSDLVKYGFIPEFISRLPSITTLAPLTIADLRRILTEVRGSLVSQYTALFGYSGVEIRFTSAALDQICRKASERGGGARGLRGIMEALLLEPMYEVPGSTVRYVLINEEVVLGKKQAMYWSRGQGPAFWAAWANEEQLAPRHQA
ncbi:ClpX ATPase regulatory subunit [Imleria badia]|nr:ClpX ATPase regulatory subunit [Imleria badia]